MPFPLPSVFHRLFENPPVIFIQRPVRAPKRFFTWALAAHAQAMNVTGHFHLLSQGKILNAADDGFDDGHFVANIEHGRK